MTAALRRFSGRGVFVVLFGILGFLVLNVFPPVSSLEIKRAAREFGAAWQGGGLAALTYDPSSAPGVGNGDPDAIARYTTRLGHDISGVDADRPISVEAVGDPASTSSTSATQILAVTWNLGAGRTWTYDTTVELRNTDNRWRVAWRPSAVHPALTYGTVLSSRRLLAARAPIRDANDQVLPPAGPSGAAGELIGDVRRATAELANTGPGRVEVNDPVGVSGVQQQFDALLAGQGGVEIDVVPDPTVAPIEPLVQQVYVSPPSPGRPIVLTLDSGLQARAEKALAGLRTPAALVAVSVRRGDVLAVANAGRDDLREKALQGQFPPGSVFRLPTMLALMRHAQVTPATDADCRMYSLAGQQFRNTVAAPQTYPVSFARAFEENCVTGFAAAARLLTGAQLQEAAQSLGYQAPSALGVPAFDGVVPAAKDPLEVAENAVGAGSVLASPLVVARASATVADGQYEASRLVTQPPQQTPAAGPALSAAEQSTLQQLMRASVQTDPAQAALRTVTTGDVAAISGTAAYGPASDATEHAWCTGYEGDIAFAVIITNSSGGAADAAAAAARFLS